MERNNMDSTNNITERMITEGLESGNENSLQIFNNEEFGKIRTVAIDGEPWFVGKDVALALGYGKGKSLANAVAAHVDTEDKGVTEMMTPGGMQKMTIINESGLYSLVLSSKLPSAKKFKRWVTSEVIPTIRKHGAYMTPQTIAKAILNPDFIINLAGRLKGEMEKNKQLSFELEQERIKSESLLESNAELAETNKSLEIDNDALVKENATWNHKSIINALMRAYGKKYCKGIIPYAYGILYKELSYKYHIDLKKRKGDTKSSYIDLLKVNELDKAVRAAAAMCKNKGMDISRTINEINAAIIS